MAVNPAHVMLWELSLVMNAIHLLEDVNVKDL